MGSAPRVLVAAESLLPIASGIGRVARLTTRLLAEDVQRGGAQVHALALSDASAATDLGVPVTACNGSRARFVLECQRAALSCTHFVYDFAGMARAHPSWHRPRRRSLVWVHGIEVWEHARRDRLRALARADMLVVNTLYTRARAERLHGGFARAVPCWLGTESDDLAPSAPLERDAANVLILGRVDPLGGEKGHRELIDAWPDVVTRVPDAQLLIAGGGPGQPIVADWAARSPARTNIQLLGFVPEEALEALWARTRVFAMPSRCEGLGLAYLDAMRHGVPIIASIHDAAREINEHGVTGFNVDLCQPGALAARIVELLQNRSLSDSFGAAGRARWQAHFRFSAFRERLRPILARFIALT